MKYDLIVVGGGPGGLMAAKTAAEDGLKVVLIERKRNITEITRACTALFYLKWVCPDGYLEPVSVEACPDITHFHNLKLGFAVDYSGPLVPYLNTIWISPGGYKVYTFKNELFSYYFDKEVFLADLLTSAQKAGAEILPETIGLGAENTPDGVKVQIRGKSGEQTIVARAAIAADGVSSKIVDSLGLNEKRKVFLPLVRGIQNIVEGVEPDITEHINSHLSFAIPSIPMGRFSIDPRDGNKQVVGNNYKYVMALPEYAPWFRNFRLLKKTAFSATIRTSIREPIAGNVIAIGDAATPIETWIQGAIACAYQAVKAIGKELNGRKGYPEYITWWQQAFYFNDPGYFRRVVAHHTLTWNKMCTEEEVDYIYQLFQDQRVVPTLELARNPEIIKKDRPELYDKVTKTIAQLMKGVEPVLAAYPPESIIYDDPDVCLKRWPKYPGY
jgi:flavin-dependent dehydrogenase